MEEKSLISIDALKAIVDGLTIQTKAGRVLSRANHAQLKNWHGVLHKMCGDMKALVDLHDPERSDEDEAEDADEKAGAQRNTAGNAIAAPQNPHGAVTASDIKAMREKALQELRASAVRAQYQFASLPTRS